MCRQHVPSLISSLSSGSVGLPLEEGMLAWFVVVKGRRSLGIWSLFRTALITRIYYNDGTPCGVDARYLYPVMKEIE